MSFVAIYGHITDEPQIGFTPKGVAYCHVRIKETERWRDGTEHHVFHSVSFWRDEAERLANEWHAGDFVLIEGALKYRKHPSFDVWVAEIRVSRAARLVTGETVVTSSPSANEGGDIPW